MSVDTQISLLEDLEELRKPTRWYAVMHWEIRHDRYGCGVRRRAINLLWKCEDSSLIPLMDTRITTLRERAAGRAALWVNSICLENGRDRPEKADPIIERCSPSCSSRRRGYPPPALET